MTEDERLREQGRMVEERREVKAKLACLSNRGRRMEVALERLATAVRQSDVENWRIDFETATVTLDPDEHERRRNGSLGPLDCPTLDEVAAFLVERRALQERFDELGHLLEI